MSQERTASPLQTTRLLLRPFSLEDAKAMLPILKDEETNTFLPWFPLKTLEETKAFLQERYFLPSGRPKPYHYAICLKEDGIPIGYLSISGEENHDLGYGLRKDMWHKGIMTEAGIAAVQQWKQDGFPYLTATHDVNNPRSGEVMKKLGMTYRYSYRECVQPKGQVVTFRLYQLDLTELHGWVYRGYLKNSLDGSSFVEEIS